MARARTIKPSFFDDIKIARCSPEARLMFIGLWTQSDMNGVFEWEPMSLRKILFGYDSYTVKDCEDWLIQLSSEEIILFSNVKNKPYGLIPTFKKHQHFHRDEKPRYLLDADTVPAWCRYGVNPPVICNQLSVINNQIAQAPDSAPQMLLLPEAKEVKKKPTPGHEHPVVKEHRRLLLEIRRIDIPADMPADKHELSSAKVLQRELGDDCLDFVKFYVSMNDDWYGKEGWPLSMARHNLSKVTARWKSSRGPANGASTADRIRREEAARKQAEVERFAELETQRHERRRLREQSQG